MLKKNKNRKISERDKQTNKQTRGFKNQNMINKTRSWKKDGFQRNNIYYNKKD